MPDLQLPPMNLIQERRLANGAQLFVKPVPGAPRLAINLYIPGGNLLDPIPGMADVLDRLLMKGTATRNQEQIAVDIDSLSLELDTDTKRDYSVMCATLLMEDLEPSLALMADLFYNSTLDEFAREKAQLAAEIQMEMDSPRARAADLLTRTVFAETPYGVTSSILLDTLPEMDRIDALQTHYRQTYRTDRLLFSVAGDLSGANFARLVDALEAAFPGDDLAPVGTGTASSVLLKQLTLKQSQYVTFDRNDSNQLHLFQAWLAPEARHVDYPALSVLNTILGGAGLSSRLFVELRDKQGLAYNVRSSFEAFKYRGLFSLYIGTEPSNRQKCIDGFRIEVEKLMNEPVSAKELAETQENILGRREVFLETAPQLAGFIGANMALGRTPEEVEHLPERIRQVTPADVQRLAQQVFSQPSVISAVGPKDSL